MTKKAGNQQLVRKTNLKLILETVKKKGPISRAQLAKDLKLSAPSVSSNIEQLLKMDLLREVGEGSSGGGRKPILLEFNKEYGYVIGVDLSSEHCQIALSDLVGNIITVEQFSLPQGKEGQKIIEQLIGTIKNIFATYPQAQERLKVITVGTPGVIEPGADTVRLSPQFQGWDHLPVKQIISQDIHVPIILKNDINLAALGEARYGAGQNYHNLAYISVDIGIGAGIILQGKLFEGSKLAAGEIGYMLPGIDLFEEDFKGYGPLESKASVPALLEQVKKALQEGRTPLLSQWGLEPEKLTLELVRKALEQGDPGVQRIVERTAQYLALATANLQAVLDLELIIIGGEIRVLANPLLEKINELAGKIMPNKPQIIYSQLDNKAGIYGGVAVGLDYVFKHLIQ